MWVANPSTDVNRSTGDGTTCLMAAAQSGKASVVQMLLQRNARPEAANRRGQRALELARSGNHSDVVTMLQPLTPSAPPPSS